MELAYTAASNPAALTHEGSTPSSSKYCNLCSQILSLDSFSFKDKKKGIRHSKCKECHTAYAKIHYKLNEETYKGRAKLTNKKSISAKVDYVRQLKEKNPCTDCGNFYPFYVMDFDHLFEKTHLISTLVKGASSMDTLNKELAKCELVCANCHRHRTYKRSQPV